MQACSQDLQEGVTRVSDVHVCMHEHARLEHRNFLKLDALRQSNRQCAYNRNFCKRHCLEIQEWFSCVWKAGIGNVEILIRGNLSY